MPRIERRIDIAAPPRVVWDISADFDRWPEWTKSTKAARREDAGPLRVGSRATLELAGGPSAPWVVTAVDEGRYFAWLSSQSGLTVIAEHTIEPKDDGGSAVTLAISTRGLNGILAWPYLRWVARRNLEWEASGLKQRAESQATET